MATEGSNSSSSSGSSSSDCPVCLEAMVSSTPLENKTLGCGHSFHVSCIKDWLAGHCTCPVCRQTDWESVREKISGVEEERSSPRGAAAAAATVVPASDDDGGGDAAHVVARRTYDEATRIVVAIRRAATPDNEELINRVVTLMILEDT
ncbi:e3 ubiquitin-protein ligase rnf6, partial [Lasius niger]